MLTRSIVGLLLTVFMVGSGLAMRPTRPALAQDDPALLRELAERMLAQQFSPTGPAQRAQLLPGRLPDDLWYAIPTPPGGRLIGSVVRPTSGV